MGHCRTLSIKRFARDLTCLVVLGCLGSGCGSPSISIPTEPRKAPTYGISAAEAPTSKNVNEAFRSKAEKLSQIAKPLEGSARKLFKEGKYRQAVAKIEEARAVWKPIGLDPGLYSALTIECFYKLKDYPAIIEYEEKYGGSNDPTRLAIGIAFLKLGEIKTAETFYDRSRLIALFGSSDDFQIPTPTDKIQLEVSLRLAGASEFFFTHQYAEAYDEAVQVVRLDSSNSLGLYLAFQTSAGLGRSYEARSYAEMVSKSGGRPGQAASEFLGSSRGLVRVN
jgi:tetratricopeptide (TPR) repeat protein